MKSERGDEKRGARPVSKYKGLKIHATTSCSECGKVYKAKGMFPTCPVCGYTEK